jgi:hypothetical protein
MPRPRAKKSQQSNRHSHTESHETTTRQDASEYDSLTYLTLPAMSAEPERVFSGAKITLSDRQCRMGDDAVKAGECLKSWQRDGSIATTRDDIRAIEEMLNELCAASFLFLLLL